MRTPSRRRTATRTVLLILALWATVRGVNRSLVRVAGWSMAPTLWPDDALLTVPVPRVLVTRLLRAGHVVVVAAPDAGADHEHLVVKRIAAVHPDGVDVRGDDPVHSTDSRRWGPVEVAAIRALVVARWPDVLTPLHRPDHGRRATTSNSGSSSATSPSARRP